MCFSMDDVKWSGKTIIVLGDVHIVEPYTEKDITGKKPRSVEHLTKIVSVLRLNNRM